MKLIMIILKLLINKAVIIIKDKEEIQLCYSIFCKIKIIIRILQLALLKKIAWIFYNGTNPISTEVGLS